MGTQFPPHPTQKNFVITIVVIVPLELLCNLYTRSAVSGACVYSSALACWQFTVLHSTCIQHCRIKLAVAGREAHLTEDDFAVSGTWHAVGKSSRNSWKHPWKHGTVFSPGRISFYISFNRWS